MLPVATQGSPLKSLSVGRTKACTWNRYLIHEPQNLFGNIVGGVSWLTLANNPLPLVESSMLIHNMNRSPLRILSRFQDYFSQTRMGVEDFAHIRQCCAHFEGQGELTN